MCLIVRKKANRKQSAPIYQFLEPLSFQTCSIFTFSSPFLPVRRLSSRQIDDEERGMRALRFGIKSLSRSQEFHVVQVFVQQTLGKDTAPKGRRGELLEDA